MRTFQKHLKRKIRHVNAAITLKAEDSGTIFMINQAAAYAITLPECATEDNKLMGWSAEFILGTVESNAVTVIVTDDDGDIMHIEYLSIDAQTQSNL